MDDGEDDGGAISSVVFDDDGKVTFERSDGTEEVFSRIEDAAAEMANRAMGRHSTADIAAGMKPLLQTIMKEFKV